VSLPIVTPKATDFWGSVRACALSMASPWPVASVTKMLPVLRAWASAGVIGVPPFWPLSCWAWDAVTPRETDISRLDWLPRFLNAAATACSGVIVEVMFWLPPPWLLPPLLLQPASAIAPRAPAASTDAIRVPSRL